MAVLSCVRDLRRPSTRRFSRVQHAAEKLRRRCLCSKEAAANWKTNGRREDPPPYFIMTINSQPEVIFLKPIHGEHRIVVAWQCLMVELGLHFLFDDQY